MYQPKLGWIPFSERTSEQHVAHIQAVRQMPEFCITNIDPGAGDINRVNLYEVWNHPLTVQSLGYPFPRVHQLTGSCVGAGLGDMLFTLSAIEVIRLNDPEQILVPFWLFTYGKSRLRMGARGQGEGSLGSTGAEAIMKDGILEATHDGLPKFQNRDGLEWTEQDEMIWSAGDEIDPKWDVLAVKHLVKTVAPCRSAIDVKQAILNYYPCTDAYDYYVGRPTINGDVLVGRPDSRGGHQTSILGWWNHPQLGELFLYQNQWPASVYPKDPAGGPACSCWIPKSEMDRICQNGEVYAYSQFQGFPAQTIDWKF